MCATSSSSRLIARGNRWIRALGLLLPAGTLLIPVTARAGLIFVTNTTGNTIGEYTDSGVPVNPSLITGLHGPVGIAISGSNLFVANSGNGTIGEYTISGAAVNAALISGLTGPVGIALSGSNLFVSGGASGSGNGKIGEYDATTGTPINAALITGLSAPYGIAVSGSELYLTNGGTSQAGGFNLSPVTLNLLISGWTYQTALRSLARICSSRTPVPEYPAPHAEWARSANMTPLRAHR